MVVISLQRDYHRLDLGPSCLSSPLAFSNLTRADSDFITDLKATFEDSSTGNTSFECLCILTRLVNIEGANYDHVGWHSELARWDWDPANVVNDDVDVVLKHGRDGDNRNRRA